LSSLILRLESLGADVEPVTPGPREPVEEERPRFVDLSDNAVVPSPLSPPQHPLIRWRSAVHTSHDACLVLDAHGTVVSISAAAAEALGCADTMAVGRQLLDVIDVVDLDTGASHPEYAVRITPLSTLGGRGLMRSLMRVRHPDGSLVTVDCASAPLHDDDGDTIGSVSFFATFATL
jgi:PAS domain S-box-containing protein